MRPYKVLGAEGGGQQFVEREGAAERSVFVADVDWQLGCAEFTQALAAAAAGRDEPSTRPDDGCFDNAMAEIGRAHV